MAYCLFSDVRSIVDTDVTDAEITNIITWVDAMIDLKIDSGAAGAVFLEALSSTWAAYRCMLKDPEASKLGEYSEDRTTALKLLKEELDFMLTIADGGISIVMGRDSLG